MLPSRLNLYPPLHHPNSHSVRPHPPNIVLHDNTTPMKPAHVKNYFHSLLQRHWPLAVPTFSKNLFFLLSSNSTTHSILSLLQLHFLTQSHTFITNSNSIMGGGASKKQKKQEQNHAVLKCPANFDPAKFQHICSLFDKLDQDANFGVSSDECRGIANLHVENRKKKLGTRREKLKGDLAKKLAEIAGKSSRDIRRVTMEATYAAEIEKEKHEREMVMLDQRATEMKSWDDDEKCFEFMKVLVPTNATHIDFWCFFEYMKSRTKDIENIPKIVPTVVDMKYIQYGNTMPEEGNIVEDVKQYGVHRNILK